MKKIIEIPIRMRHAREATNFNDIEGCTLCNAVRDIFKDIISVGVNDIAAMYNGEVDFVAIIPNGYGCLLYDQDKAFASANPHLPDSHIIRTLIAEYTDDACLKQPVQNLTEAICYKMEVALPELESIQARLAEFELQS